MRVFLAYKGDFLIQAYMWKGLAKLHVNRGNEKYKDWVERYGWDYKFHYKCIYVSDKFYFIN